MKKVFIKMMAMLIVSISLISMFACGPQAIEDQEATDPNKTQVYYYYYDGDGSKEYLKNAATEFNKTQTKFQIKVVGTLNENYAQQLISGGGNASIHELTSSVSSYLVDSGTVANLDDMLDCEIESGVKLKDKMLYVDETREFGSTTSHKGLYGIPIASYPVHLIIDYQMFKDNGWLISEGGKLSVGNDGIEGTYDDGMPVTIAEWDEMVRRIDRTPNTEPFIFSTKYNFYIEPLIHSLIASYGGWQEYIDIFSATGFYKDSDGNSHNVTLENGYEMYKADSFYKAMKFMEDYICNKDYMHEKAKTSTGLTHKEAVNYFISGYKDEVQQAGMLIEYPTFEDSNKYYFSLLTKAGDVGKGYGERDFRYLLLPRLNDNETLSYMATSGMGMVVVSEDADKERLQVAKDFLLYTLRDEYLQQFSLGAGGIKRNFNYSLTEEQLSQFTPFQRTNFTMMADTAHIKLLTGLELAGKDPESRGMVYKTAAYQFTALMGDGLYERPLLALRRYNAKEYVDGIYKFRKEEMWGVK
ncbi:MAG: extracellular solute-binding protein [Clostridia bacterium]|nr:extracellular solute-binding protein [Clostridia bacterium]